MSKYQVKVSCHIVLFSHGRFVLPLNKCFTVFASTKFASDVRRRGNLEVGVDEQIGHYKKRETNEKASFYAPISTKFGNQTFWGKYWTPNGIFEKFECARKA